MKRHGKSLNTLNDMIEAHEPAFSKLNEIVSDPKDIEIKLLKKQLKNLQDDYDAIDERKKKILQSELTNNSNKILIDMCETYLGFKIILINMNPHYDYKLYNGMKLTLQNLESVLYKYNIRIISQSKVIYDPLFYESIHNDVCTKSELRIFTDIEPSEIEDIVGKVLIKKVISDGFAIGNNVLIPAKVETISIVK